MADFHKICGGISGSLKTVGLFVIRFWEGMYCLITLLDYYQDGWSTGQGQLFVFEAYPLVHWCCSMDRGGRTPSTDRSSV